MDKGVLADGRWKAKTNLWFLATELLQYELLSERVHKPICDFFVQKDPRRGIYDQDPEFHTRLLLDPRYHLKTTIDAISDTIQWLLAFPNCRIMLMSGTVPLTSDILKVIKSHFTTNEKLLAFFPEYRLFPGKNDGTAYSFTVPCRSSDCRYREGSVTVATARSTKAGLHFDIGKYDDIVDEINSKTKEGLQKTIDDMNDTLPLIDPKGYKDVCGTFYDQGDAYNWMLEQEKERLKLGMKPEVKVSIRRAVEVDEQGRFTAASPILFPEKFDYETLRSIQHKDPQKFAFQFLLLTSLEDLGGFSKTTMEKACIPFSLMSRYLMMPAMEGGNVPRRASIYICWDMASSDEETSDYRAGAVGLFDPLGRLHIVDLAVGRFNAYELPTKIWELARTWAPWLGKVGIEKSSGVEYLKPSIENIQFATGFHFDIDWIKTHPKKTKASRILSLLPLIKQGQVFFNKDLKDIDLLMTQFTRYRPGTRGHDDIPDAISRLIAYKECVDFIRPQQPGQAALPEMPVNAGNGLGGGLCG